MHDPIEYRISGRRGRKEAMPLVGRILARDEQRTSAHAPVNDFQQYVRHLRAHVADAEVIEDKQARLGQLELGQ